MSVKFKIVLIALFSVMFLAKNRAAALDVYMPPPSPRQCLNFNPVRRFRNGQTVSTPHSFNDVDLPPDHLPQRRRPRHLQGLSWYRKHFKLPADAAGHKVFLEFEGMRQAGDIFLNGKPGRALRERRHRLRRGHHRRRSLREPGERAGGEGGQPHRLQGARHRHSVRMERQRLQSRPRRHQPPRLAARHRQDLSDAAALLRPGNHRRLCACRELQHRRQRPPTSPSNRKCANESGDRATVGLSAVIVDQDGRSRAVRRRSRRHGRRRKDRSLTASGALKDARFWSPDDPYLYDVYTILTVDGKVVDVNKVVTTGFRKTEFKGGAGTGGVYHQRQVRLPERLRPALQQRMGRPRRRVSRLDARLHRQDDPRQPRQLHALDAHCAAARRCRCPTASASSRSAPPATRSATSRAPVGAARRSDARHHDLLPQQPQHLFWEAGNTVVTAEQMQQMVALRKQWDPDGGRVMGARGNDNVAANTATLPSPNSTAS
jgi:beta-galactosidase